MTTYNFAPTQDVVTSQLPATTTVSTTQVVPTTPSGVNLGVNFVDRSFGPNVQGGNIYNQQRIPANFGYNSTTGAPVGYNDTVGGITGVNSNVGSTVAEVIGSNQPVINTTYSPTIYQTPNPPPPVTQLVPVGTSQTTYRTVVPPGVNIQPQMAGANTITSTRQTQVTTPVILSPTTRLQPSEVVNGGQVVQQTQSYQVPTYQTSPSQIQSSSVGQVYRPVQQPYQPVIQNVSQQTVSQGWPQQSRGQEVFEAEPVNVEEYSKLSVNEVPDAKSSQRKVQVQRGNKVEEVTETTVTRTRVVEVASKDSLVRRAFRTIFEQRANFRPEDIDFGVEVISRMTPPMHIEQLSLIMLYSNRLTQTGRFAISFNYDLDMAIVQRDVGDVTKLCSGGRNMFVELYDNQQLTREEFLGVATRTEKEYKAMYSAIMDSEKTGEDIIVNPQSCEITMLQFDGISDTYPGTSTVDDLDPSNITKDNLMRLSEDLSNRSAHSKKKVGTYAKCFKDICVWELDEQQIPNKNDNVVLNDSQMQMKIPIVESREGSMTKELFCFDYLELIFALSISPIVNPKTMKPFSSKLEGLLRFQYIIPIKLYQRALVSTHRVYPIKNSYQVVQTVTPTVVPALQVTPVPTQQFASPPQTVQSGITQAGVGYPQFGYPTR